jgi:hypothetical protein
MQNPFEPVDSSVGLMIIALTVFDASTTLGSCDVSKNAKPPERDQCYNF